MKIYIQSRSGNFNTTLLKENGLADCWNTITEAGCYPMKYRDRDILVPLHEIEYIREADENDE